MRQPTVNLIRDRVLADARRKLARAPSRHGVCVITALLMSQQLSRAARAYKLLKGVVNVGVHAVPRGPASLGYGQQMKGLRCEGTRWSSFRCAVTIWK
jgi:hypothetical protein